jgi:site-specific recombinase XerD
MGMPDLQPYHLRHHSITVMLESPEVSDQTVEEMCGHIDPDTKKRYSHLRQKARMEAAQVLMAKKAVKVLEGRKYRKTEPKEPLKKPVQNSTTNWPSTFWASNWNNEKST